MGILEIVLLLAGGILAVASFVVPVGKEEVPKETKKLAQDEVKTLVSLEMDGIRQHVDDVVDEAIEYAVEKTERSLERLTNEKIMAVNEYSDTVLQEIHKNHEEAMFLYDMLNDKHKNLKNTVSEVNKTVQEVTETKREAEAVVNSFQQLKPDRVETPDEKKEWDFLDERKAELLQKERLQEPSVKEVPDTKKKPARKKVQPKEESLPSQAPSSAILNFISAGQDSGTNNNEKILALHKQGKSNVAIARELGLGVGEVKLVIDLYKNM